MSNSVQTLTIGELFDSARNPEPYVIPIYQRNYSWGQAEIDQLIQDIYDYSKNRSENDYFIGSLVVFERQNNGTKAYEIIDGQQRLTTLTILLSALQREYSNISGYKLNLKFDSRKKSTTTLEAINNHQREVNYPHGRDYNLNIQEGYEDAVKQLQRLLPTGEEFKSFFNYLIKKVKILRVSVPQDTELNHYFEIMNTRGEQLEKHEVLKAKMMEVLQKEPHSLSVFQRIWEASADMERYVQYGFSPYERTKLFGNEWNELLIKNFDEVREKLNTPEEDFAVKENSSKMSLFDIITFSGNFNANEGKEGVPERFNSIINFSNFLLHVLRIQTGEDIPLDDKRLISSFQIVLSSFEDDNYKKCFVKEFAYNLLKIKFLFDQNIIKREFFKDRDGWSLKKLKNYGGSDVNYVSAYEGEESLNKEILILLSMFHVSAPTLIYKHWLNGALNYCFHNCYKLEALAYSSYLKELAKAFFFDRYISKEDNGFDFYEIIIENKGSSQNKDKPENQDWNSLHRGTKVENFIFNYLDYLLWKNKRVTGDFRFSFKTSVEHFYPQFPPDGIRKLNDQDLHHFGNLCLMSRERNSRFTNNMPSAKAKNFQLNELDSLKMKLMFDKADEEWTEIQIIEHGNNMIEIFKEEANV